MASGVQRAHNAQSGVRLPKVFRVRLVSNGNGL